MPKSVTFEVADILFDTFLEFAGSDIPKLKEKAANHLGSMMKSRCEGHIDRQIEALVAEETPDANAIGTLELKKKAIAEAIVTITGVN